MASKPIVPLQQQPRGVFSSIIVLNLIGFSLFFMIHCDSFWGSIFLFKDWNFEGFVM
jgi:hypothetical protein